MSNKDYALLYLENGFSVIPTRGKKPLVEWQKYGKERPTVEQVIEWWTKWPDADIACPTGSVSNIVVVDIDGGQVPSLPSTSVSETSPGHFQYFFKHPGSPVQNSAKVVAENIDIRGDGGFVVLPPSKHFNKETDKQDYIYKWINSPKKAGFAELPSWVLERIKDKKHVETLVQGSSKGSRNNDAASLIGSLLVRYPKEEWESVCWPLVQGWNDKNQPPLNERELRSVFGSIASRQISKNSRQNTNPYTIGTDVSQVSEKRLPSLTPILLSELSKNEAPIQWVWEGYLAKQHLTLLSALWKAGKTTLIANFLKALQEERDLAGQATHRAKVLILSEESANIWARRRDEHEITLPIWILSRPIKQKLGYKEWVSLLEQMAFFCKQNEIDLFIVDTLSAFWSVDNENDAARVGEALLPINHLLDNNIAVLLVHHFRKSGGDEGTAARGSGALGAGVDIMIDFSRRDKENPNSTQRVLKSYSRFEETPKEIVINYIDGEYQAEGTKAVVDELEKLETLLDILDEYPEGVTVSELLINWSEGYGPKPIKRTLQRHLVNLVELNKVIIIDKKNIKGGKASVYQKLSSNNLQQEPATVENTTSSNQLQNQRHDTNSNGLTQVQETNNLTLTEEEKTLIEKEQKLRNLLSTLDKNSAEYATNHHEWFASREEGLQLGLYQFFIPSNNEPWMKRKEIHEAN